MDELTEFIRIWAEESLGPPYQADQVRGERCGDNGKLRLFNHTLDLSGISGLEWKRLAPSVSNEEWRLSVRLATEGNDVEIDIEIQGVESIEKLINTELLVCPPSFLNILVDKFECSLDGFKMNCTATPILLQDSCHFAERELYVANRRTPIVVVSGRHAEEFSSEADRLQGQLLGIAKVFTYDHDTAWSIAKDLPRPLRCYDGAIRLYSPGCSKDDISQQHPYWMREDAEKLGGQFWKIIRDECIKRVSSHGRRRLFAQVRSRIQQDETDRLEARVDQFEQGTPESENDSWDELLEMFLEPPDDMDSVSKGKYNALLTVARAQRNKADNLVLENERLRYSLDQLRAGESQSSVLASEDQVIDENHDQPLSFQSVLEAVEFASENLSGLRFLRSAFETAKSGYTRTHDGQADEVYEALSVLNECAERRDKGGLGISLEKWFKSRKVEFSNEAKATIRKFSDERRFQDDEIGEHILMTQHLKLLHNDIRIHVKWDKSNSKYLIGHIGEHLPTSTDPH